VVYDASRDRKGRRRPAGKEELSTDGRDTILRKRTNEFPPYRTVRIARPSAVQLLIRRVLSSLPKLFDLAALVVVAVKQINPHIYSGADEPLWRILLQMMRDRSASDRVCAKRGGTRVGSCRRDCFTVFHISTMWAVSAVDAGSCVLVRSTSCTILTETAIPRREERFASVLVDSPRLVNLKPLNGQVTHAVIYRYQPLALLPVLSRCVRLGPMYRRDVLFVLIEIAYRSYRSVVTWLILSAITT